MKRSNFFKDKVVWITGSGSGIGKELARQILELGGIAVITGRNKSKLSNVTLEFADYERRCLVLEGDCTNHEMSKEILSKIITHFGRLDILIANAGLSNYGEVELLKPGVVKQVIETNILGTLFPVMACIPELKRNKGSILMVSSIAAFYGLPVYSVYSTSKMALTSFHQSLRIELQKAGVFVGIAYLGFTENEDQKRILNPSGMPERVPDRSKTFLHSRKETVERMLIQLVKSRSVCTHTVLGKTTQLMARYFPFLLGVILFKGYKRNLES